MARHDIESITLVTGVQREPHEVLAQIYEDCTKISVIADPKKGHHQAYLRTLQGLRSELIDESEKDLLDGWPRVGCDPNPASLKEAGHQELWIAVSTHQPEQVQVCTEALANVRATERQKKIRRGGLIALVATGALMFNQNSLAGDLIAHGTDQSTQHVEAPSDSGAAYKTGPPSPRTTSAYELPDSTVLFDGNFFVANVLADSHDDGKGKNSNMRDGAVRQRWLINLLKEQEADFGVLIQEEFSQRQAFRELAGEKYQIFSGDKEVGKAIFVNTEKYEKIGKTEMYRAVYKDGVVGGWPMITLRDRENGGVIKVLAVYNPAPVPGITAQHDPSTRIKLKEVRIADKLPENVPVIIAGEFKDPGDSYQYFVCEQDMVSTVGREHGKRCGPPKELTENTGYLRIDDENRVKVRDYQNPSWWFDRTDTRRRINGTITDNDEMTKTRITITE